VAGVLVARATFTVEHDGSEVIVREGETRLAADHAIVKGREHLFAPLEERDEPNLETEKPTRRRRVSPKSGSRGRRSKG
jgi:hypothetical protein